MRRKTLRTVSFLLGLTGIGLLFATVFPIVSYEISSGEKYPQLISPIQDKGKLPKLTSIDYTKASNWFVGGVKPKDFDYSKVSFYTISIPKLKIKDATVAIGGEDLSQSLIHYPGTALPGRYGSTVIFGHSVLPIFFNPKNYKSIFSTLPKLTIGDEIDVNYDGVSYKFKVEDTFEVRPDQVEVLDQDTSDSFLLLVTCTPPGDPRKPKRLIVKARIVLP